MPFVFRPAALAAGALCAVTLASCGKSYVKEERLPETGAQLEGTVTYGGNKLHYAMITVVGGGKSATGQIGEDGTFKVLNVPLGDVAIGVNTAAAQGEVRARNMQASAGGKEKKKAEPFMEVPAKFFEPEKSGIKTTIVAGDNTYNIVLNK